MATEYKLSYTAQEIDEKIGKIVDLDATLTQSGKAADAMATGDAIEQTSKKIVEEVGAKKNVSGTDIEISENGTIYITDISMDAPDDTVISWSGKNLLNEEEFLNGVWDYSAWHTDTFNFELPDGTYTFSFQQKNVDDGNGEWLSLQVSSDNFATIDTDIAFFETTHGWKSNVATFTIRDGEKARIRHYSNSYILKRDYFMSNVMLEVGAIATEYVPYMPPIEIVYGDLVQDNIRVPACSSYIRITNSGGHNMDVSYTVNGILYDYINKVVEKKDEVGLYVTPQMYGAKGDGTTDDTEAIQAAIDSGHDVIIPATKRFYVFTQITIPENAHIEINGEMQTSTTNAIVVNGSNINIGGHGEVKFFGTGSLVKIDLAGKRLADIEFSVPMTGNEYEPNTKDCVGIEITLGHGAYGCGYPYIIKSRLKNFSIGVWQHAESDTHADSWSSGILFDGEIMGCTEAIRIEAAGTGSIINGTMQPHTSQEAAHTINKPYITINNYTAIRGMVWDYGEAVNKYIFRCIGMYNYIENCSWIVHAGLVKYDNLYQVIAPRAGENFVPRIKGQYADDIADVDSTSNILLNAHKNKNISVNILPTNCTISNADAMHSCVNECMSFQKTDFSLPAVCEVEYVFASPISLKNICVQAEHLPDEVTFEVYDANGALMDSVLRKMGEDYFIQYGFLSNASWCYVFRDDNDILEAKVKKIKIRLTAKSVGTCRIYNISAKDGTEFFVSKAGGDVYGELDFHDGLCLYDDNGTRYKLTVGSDGTLTIPGSGGNVDLDTTLTEEGKAADAKAVGNAINQLSGEIDCLSDVCYIESPNLYDPSLQTVDTIDDRFYFNGAPYNTDQFDGNYDTSAPIAVKENTQYTIGYVPAIVWGSYSNLVKPWNEASQGLWFYDENDVCLGYTNNNTFTTPFGTKYIRFMYLCVWDDTQVNLDNANERCMLVKGASLPSTYEPFVKKIDTRKMTHPVRYFINGDEVRVGSRYNNTHDMMVTLKKKGGNNIFDFYQFSLVPIGEPLEGIDSNNSITLQTTPTDWHAPYQMSAVNNADGDAVDSHHWTGGNHEYTNTGTGGTPTARTASVTFVADGKEVTEGSGHCNRLEILWTDFTQAYNTKKEDGTGREVLESRHMMAFDGVKWETKTELEPLEDIVMDVSYGLQLVCGGLYDKVRYYGAVNRAEYETTGVKTTSGNKDATAMYWHGDEHAVMLEIDPTFDIGNRQFYSGTDGIFTTNYGKGYCNFFSNTPLTAGNIYSFRGSYQFMPYRGN